MLRVGRFFPCSAEISQRSRFCHSDERQSQQHCGPKHFDDLAASMRAAEDVSTAISVSVDDIPLWQVVRAIVEQVLEIQVIELQHALEYFGKKTSRQAIESALASQIGRAHV
jgi:hypothetical protein